MNILKAPREKRQDTYKGLEMEYCYFSKQFWILEENGALSPKFREEKLSILESSCRQTKDKILLYMQVLKISLPYTLSLEAN